MLLIPENKTQIGGPASFLQNFKTFLKLKGYAFITSSFHNASTLFILIQHNLKALKKYKRYKKPIIQRLDGIFYPSKHGEEYVSRNENIKEIYFNFASHVIFQSEYCKKQCFDMFGEISENKYSVIHNGADTNIFFPDSEKPSIHKYKFITTGVFRNRIMLQPIIEALDSLKDKAKFSLTVVGPINDPSLNSYIQRAYVNHIPEVDLLHMAQLLREHHIFIYSHLNPPCPNSVIEAISCGLPIVGFNSGSMKELCSFSSDLLAYVSNETFQKEEDFKAQKLAEKIVLCISKFDHYKNLALSNSNKFDFDTCGEQYTTLFKRYERKSNSIYLKVYRIILRIIDNMIKKVN
jgi:glycosyltransferase involved in cell wall biosynthesis